MYLGLANIEFEDNESDDKNKKNKINKNYYNLFSVYDINYRYQCCGVCSIPDRPADPDRSLWPQYCGQQ